MVSSDRRGRGVGRSAGGREGGESPSRRFDGRRSFRITSRHCSLPTSRVVGGPLSDLRLPPPTPLDPFTGTVAEGTPRPDARVLLSPCLCSEHAPDRGGRNPGVSEEKVNRRALHYYPPSHTGTKAPSYIPQSGGDLFLNTSE